MRGSEPGDRDADRGGGDTRSGRRPSGRRPEGPRSSGTSRPAGQEARAGDARNCFIVSTEQPLFAIASYIAWN